MWQTEIVDGSELEVAEVQALYRASTLDQRRPVTETERFAGMLCGANLIVTARVDGRLVGFCRALTDGHYATYLCDLAVDQEFQCQGIGADLVWVTRAAAPRAKLILLAAPAAAEYYPRIGFTRHNSAWVLDALAS